jgi:hypothetical protein
MAIGQTTSNSLNELAADAFFGLLLETRQAEFKGPTMVHCKLDLNIEGCKTRGAMLKITAMNFDSAKLVNTHLQPVADEGSAATSRANRR